MKRAGAVLCGLLVASTLARSESDRLRLITLAPGHFHAALIQKNMLPGVADNVAVYGPLGPDLLAHLARIAQFNSRADNPTHWALSIYAGPDYWEKLLAERPGDIVVLSGANDGKVDRLRALVDRKLHVLVDKPWIIEAQDLPTLEAVLDAADQAKVIAYDGMTQRFELTCILQRALVNDPDVFGLSVPGSEADPGVSMESVHYLLKSVAGAPSLRPAWFFDIRQQGEGLADVGTHLADLVQWTLFPDQPINYRREIQLLRGRRWPTVLSLTDFERVTGEHEYPPFLSGAVRQNKLSYDCNNSVLYTLRGVYVNLKVQWNFEAAPGSGDTERAVFRGTKCRVEVRQGQEEGYRPEIYVVPNRPDLLGEAAAAVQRRLAALVGTWPGLSAEVTKGRVRVVIPERYRIGHEAHFARLAEQFMDYVRNPGKLPAWEKPNMAAKYFVTTGGVALARQAETK
jgi:predicted dehydrogenase